MSDALIDVPASVKKGEVFIVKVVLSHIMETGYRRDITGKVIARNIIRRFTAHYDGTEVFAADLTQAVAANPYFGFAVVAVNSGPMVFQWVDDTGVQVRDQVLIRVDE